MVQLSVPRCCHLPAASQGCPASAAVVATLGPEVMIPTVLKDQNESHTDVLLCILLTSTKGFSKITT